MGAYRFVEQFYKYLCHFFLVVFFDLLVRFLFKYLIIFGLRGGDKLQHKMGLPKAVFLSPTPDQIERLRSDFFDRLNRDGAPCEGIFFPIFFMYFECFNILLQFLFFNQTIIRIRFCACVCVCVNKKNCLQYNHPPATR